MTRPRQGSSLLELLVALPMAALVASLGAVLLVRVARSARAHSAALVNTGTLRHARAVLAADLAPLAGGDLRIVVDSMLEFRSQLGVVRVCEHVAARSIIAAVPGESSDSWLTGVRDGDSIRLWLRSPRVEGAPVSRLMALESMPSALPGGPCGLDSLASHGRRWRLALTDSVPPVVTGVIASLHRDVRYRHYRTAAGWWLGRQAREGAVWDVIQPVVGPLLSAEAGGVHVQAYEAQGTPRRIGAHGADAAPAPTVAVGVWLRAERRVREAGIPGRDSSFLWVPLRGAPRHRGR